MNLREKLKALLAEAKALADKSEKEELSADDLTRWDALKGEIDDVRQKLAAEDQRRQDAQSWRGLDQQLSQSRGSVAGVVPPGEQNGLTPQQMDNAERRTIQTLGQRVTESEVYKRWKEGGFNGNTGKIDVRTLYRGRFSGQASDLTGPEAQYALIRSGNLPTDMIQPYRVPGIFAADLPDFTVRQAFVNLETTAQLIVYYRELLRTNAAAFVAEATATTGASGTKPESAVTWERAESVVQVLANWMPMTTQIAADDPAMRGIIEDILVDYLTEVEDDALLNGTGTAPEIRGLLNHTGIQVADAAYFAANPVESAGFDNENLNRLLRGRTLVRYVGRATPTFYFINPTDMEEFMTITDAQRQYLAGGPFAGGLIPTIWRLPVIETEAITAGTWVCGAGRAAAVFDRMDATVTAGWINDQFIRNMFTLLAEERLTLAVFRPAAFVHGTFAA